MITRDELKNELINIGVSEQLLEMPAVLERTYTIVKGHDTEKIEDIILDEKIKVDENGDFSLGKYDFKHGKDDNGAIIQFKDEEKRLTTIDVDQYGMDMRYYRDSDPLAATFGMPDDEEVIRIPETNSIKFKGTANDGTQYVKREVNDLGNYNILDNPDVLLYEYTRIRGENKKFLTQQYPITKGWFREREENENSIIQENEENTRPDVNQESKRNTEENRRVLMEATRRIEQLESENQKLKDENRNNQKMLKTTLEFCDRVRSSMVGHLFFRKELGQLPQAQTENDEER